MTILTACVSRRRLLRTTMLGAAASASAILGGPTYLRAQGAAVKLGVLHPVSGALSYSGQQGRLGATLAIEEINAAGGIKALNGAKIEPILGDAQSTPEGGNAEVEKMNSAGVAAKTVVIVHEDSAFGSGLAKLLNEQLPGRGFQVLETISHPTPTRDFNNVVLKIRAHNPDLVIPANYYNEYVLLARTMQQQRVQPKGIYSVLGGAASSYKFVKEFAEAAQYIMDCNHWFDPRNPKSAALRKKVENKGEFYTYEVFMNYSCVLLLADAIERAGSAERPKLISALESSTFAGHVMPYGPTRFVNGQNQGAAPVNTQVLGNDIQVIFPDTFASAKPVFPIPRA